MSDVEDALNLGAERDVFKIPRGPVAMWAEGDEPHHESVDLNEYPVELLRLKKCRSFRADLRHKLTIIIRAHGGYGNRGLLSSAKTLGISIRTLSRWFYWHNCPQGRHFWERIDTQYEHALARLVADKMKKRK